MKAGLKHVKNRIRKNVPAALNLQIPAEHLKRRLSPIPEGPYGDEGIPKFNIATVGEKQNGSYQPYVSRRRASVMAVSLGDR